MPLLTWQSDRILHFGFCEPDQLRELSILLSNKTRSKKFQYFWSKMSQKCTSFIAILIFSYVSEPPRLFDSGTCLLAYFFGDYFFEPYYGTDWWPCTHITAGMVNECLIMIVKPLRSKFTTPPYQLPLGTTSFSFFYYYYFHKGTKRTLSSNQPLPEQRWKLWKWRFLGKTSASFMTVWRSCFWSLSHPPPTHLQRTFHITLVNITKTIAFP